jgi:hypothetical protein
VPEPELEHEWAAVLLDLVNRNDVAGPPISVKFTFDAEPRQANVVLLVNLRLTGDPNALAILLPSCSLFRG